MDHIIKNEILRKKCGWWKAGANTENVKGILPENVWVVFELSDGMSEKTKSEKEKESEKRLKIQRHSWNLTKIWYSPSLNQT